MKKKEISCLFPIFFLFVGLRMMVGQQNPRIYTQQNFRDSWAIFNLQLENLRHLNNSFKIHTALHYSDPSCFLHKWEDVPSPFLMKWLNLVGFNYLIFGTSHSNSPHHEIFLWNTINGRGKWTFTGRIFQFYLEFYTSWYNCACFNLKKHVLEFHFMTQLCLF